ncbi:hypothetical protein D3C71_1773730 [compost metagenome]
MALASIVQPVANRVLHIALWIIGECLQQGQHVFRLLFEQRNVRGPDTAGTQRLTGEAAQMWRRLLRPGLQQGERLKWRTDDIAAQRQPCPFAHTEVRIICQWTHRLQLVGQCRLRVSANQIAHPSPHGVGWMGLPVLHIAQPCLAQ